MKEQVIQNFLNLPGLVGVALIDGHSRPYFCGVDKSLDFQQKAALSQGIQQVISTTPASFEAFDFCFLQQDVRIYKLTSGVILLVVTNEGLDPPIYQEAVLQLKQTLQADPHNAVSTFRLLAGSTTLSKQQYHSNGRPPAESKTTESIQDKLSTQDASSHSTTVVAYQWHQIIATLNKVTDATARYLGKIVVANTWRSTRPEGEALENLQLDRSGYFSCSPDAKVDINEMISPEDHEALHRWVQQFIGRCSLIILDYPEMVLHQALDDQQKLLLGIEVT